MADNILTSVLRGTLTRSRVEVGTEIKRGAQNVLGEATNGAVGTIPNTDGRPVDVTGDAVRRGAQRLANGQSADQVAGQMTQDVLNKFGPGAQKPPGLLDTLTSIPGRLANSLVGISPTTGSRIGLPGGFDPTAAVNAKMAEWKAQLSGQVLPNGAAEVLSQFKTKPTAEQIGKLVEQGKLDSHLAQDMINANLVELPDPKTIGRQRPAPVEDRSFRVAQATPAQPAVTTTAPAQPEQTGGFIGWLKSKLGAGTAAVSTAVAVAVTPAPVIADAPTAPPTVAAADNTSYRTLQAPEPVASMAPLKAIDLAAPAVTAAVIPSVDFKIAAAPVVAEPPKPSATAQLDSMISQEKDAARMKTLEAARAQIQANYGGPSNG